MNYPDTSKRPRFLAVAGTFLAALLSSPAVGQSQDPQTELVVSAVHGTALQLVDAQWVEMQSGDTLLELDGVRTLRGGRLELRWQNAVIEIGSEGAMSFELEVRPGGAQLVVMQYAGGVSIDCSRHCGDELTVRTPSLDVSSTDGLFTTAVVGANTEVVASTGIAWATSRLTGQRVTLSPGEAVVLRNGDQGAFEVIGAGHGKSPGANNGNAPNTNNGNGGSGNNGGNGNGPNGNGGTRGGNGNGGNN
jgi:hypothetical protein